MLLKLVGDAKYQPQLKSDPRFCKQTVREKRRPKLMEIAEQRAANKSVKYCEEFLLDRGTPCSRNNSVSDLLHNSTYRT